MTLPTMGQSAAISRPSTLQQWYISGKPVHILFDCTFQGNQNIICRLGSRPLQVDRQYITIRLTYQAGCHRTQNAFQAMTPVTAHQDKVYLLLCCKVHNL